MPFGKACDVVLIHACAVTQAAESEVLRTARKLRGAAFVVLAGCVAPDALPRAREAADCVLNGSENIAQRVTAAWTKSPLSAQPVHAEITPSFTTTRAWLKVQDGCDFRCAYCIVPDTRGAPRSRPLDECLREAEALFAAGHRELVITGCNISCWQENGLRLPDLLARLAARTPFPEARLRVGSLEPGATTREVVDLMAETPAFCRFLHVPLQHAAPEILRAMRRRCAVEEGRALLEHARAKIPGVALGADFITGFPGETEEAFEALRAFIASQVFANLHVFPYSERPGTPAAEMPGAVPHALRKSRARELIQLGAWQRATFATEQVGCSQRVLIERVAHGVGTGWTDTYLPCRVAGLTAKHCGRIVDFVPTRFENETLC